MSGISFADASGFGILVPDPLASTHTQHANMQREGVPMIHRLRSSSLRMHKAVGDCDCESL